MKKAFWLTGAAILALAQPASAGDTIKIGFVSTFSGPTAVIGNDMRNSFELALDHLGRKMGGKRLPRRIVQRHEPLAPAFAFDSENAVVGRKHRTRQRDQL